MPGPRIVVAALGVLLLASCGGGGGPGQPAADPTPAPPPTQNDFSLSVPDAISIQQGAGGSVTVTIQRQGDPGDITLSLAGSSLLAKAGGTDKIGYAFTASGDNAILTLQVGSQVPQATYPLTVTGQAGNLSHSVSFTLNVAAAKTTASFGLSMPDSASIRQGGVVTLALAISGDGFTDGTLSLAARTAVGLSATARLYGDDADKVGYAFDSVGPHGGNLTLYVGESVAPGAYPLTVTASSGGESHSASFTLHLLARGSMYEIWPTDSYQGSLQKLQPGDVLVLHQGTYPGYAVLRLNGTEEKPITIRGYGHGEAKPVLEYTGSSQNQWEIRGSNLIIQGLEFDTPQTYSIRIRAPASGPVDNVTLVDNTFVGCGDGCISANDSGVTYNDIRIIDNLMLDAQRTPVYIGNHEGLAPFHDFVFEGNVIDGRSIVANDVVGYGIEVKLNVENAELRNNYIVGTLGPGIMTYGLEADKNPDWRDVIEGNIVVGSCTDRGILVGAGPAIARRNLSMGGHSGGYGIYDYGSRHLSAGIQVIGNTAMLNQSEGFWVTSHTQGTGLEDLRMTDNLAYPPSGGVGFLNLPASNGSNDIHDNRSEPSTGMMAPVLAQLQHVIPSPQDLKPIWPLLSQGPLQPAQLTKLLDALDSLANQSANNQPRSCQ